MSCILTKYAFQIYFIHSLSPTKGCIVIYRNFEKVSIIQNWFTILEQLVKLEQKEIISTCNNMYIESNKHHTVILLL